jgi:catechol 2,3-dioxygenase-like lactoylglutathione lyase family enzyme
VRLVTDTTAEQGVEADPVVFNHVGICVTDLGRSRRFYEEALSFRYWWDLVAPEGTANKLLHLPSPLGLRAVYMIRDGLVLELLEFQTPGSASLRARRMNDLGLTHLSFSVDDLGQVLARVPDLGGEVLQDTSVPGAVMIRDPDGQLVELTSTSWRRQLPPLPS